jgi:hypothetical protein
LYPAKVLFSSSSSSMYWAYSLKSSSTCDASPAASWITTVHCIQWKNCSVKWQKKKAISLFENDSTRNRHVVEC